MMDLRVEYLGIVDFEVRKHERPIWFARRSGDFENPPQKLAAGQNISVPRRRAPASREKELLGGGILSS
jgi:hypothetical protein